MVADTSGRYDSHSTADFNASDQQIHADIPFDTAAAHGVERKRCRRVSAEWMGARLSSALDIGWLRTSRSASSSNHPATLAEFTLIDSLGSGAFGKVFLVQHQKTGSRFAMKLLPKHRIVRKAMVENVLSELGMLEELAHPFIVTLWFTFQDECYIYIMTEYLIGGDLRYHLNQEGRLSESRAKLYLCELALALEYLRNKGIAHLDIKPDNMLLDRLGHIRLADFNLAVRMKNAETMEICSFTGTRAYMAPEILRTTLGRQQGYGLSADWWSLGVCFYEMLRGRLPFEFPSSLSSLQVLTLHEARGYVLPAKWPSDLSSFVGQILHPAPSERITTLAQLTAHCYMSRINILHIYDRRGTFLPLSAPFAPRVPPHRGEMSERDIRSSPVQKRLQRKERSLLRKRTSGASSPLSTTSRDSENLYGEALRQLNEGFKSFNRLRKYQLEAPENLPLAEAPPFNKVPVVSTANKRPPRRQESLF